MIIVLNGSKFINAEGEVKTGTENTRLYSDTVLARVRDTNARIAALTEARDAMVDALASALTA